MLAFEEMNAKHLLFWASANAKTNANLPYQALMEWSIEKKRFLLVFAAGRFSRRALWR